MDSDEDFDDEFFDDDDEVLDPAEVMNKPEEKRLKMPLKLKQQKKKSLRLKLRNNQKNNINGAVSVVQPRLFCRYFLFCFSCLSMQYINSPDVTPVFS